MDCITFKKLPENVRQTLPGQALDLYKQAFMDAWERYQTRKHRDNADREEAAHRVAWSKVQSKFPQDLQAV